MANERYAEKAVGLLGAYVETQYPIELRAIETEQSLTVNSLTDPDAYLLGNIPDDNRSLVATYAESWGFEDQLNSILVADCVVAISFSSDCDLEAGELRLRRYATALLNTVRDNPTLTGGVIQCIIGDGNGFAARGDDSNTRFTYEQPIEVWLQDT